MPTGFASVTVSQNSDADSVVAVTNAKSSLDPSILGDNTGTIARAFSSAGYSPENSEDCCKDGFLKRSSWPETYYPSEPLPFAPGSRSCHHPALEYFNRLLKSETEAQTGDGPKLSDKGQSECISQTL